MPLAVAREQDTAANCALLVKLTARLPQWFAQTDSNRHYAEQAGLLDGWVARADGHGVGLLLLKRHGPASAEIYWLGVDPDHHSRGIGRALVGAATRQLEREKVRFLFVMTLHPDVDYEPYRRTRAFYERLGFSFVLATDHGPLGRSSDPLGWYLKAL